MNEEEKKLIVDTIHAEMAQERHHPDQEVPLFRTKKAMHRCFLVFVLLGIAQGCAVYLHHELAVMCRDFAAGSLFDFLLFGTIES